MPHSVSGIYSMYYANKYPDEIKEIIGIDCTLPQVVEYFNEPAPVFERFIPDWNCKAGSKYESREVPSHYG